jgi:hypothetical protein
MTEREDIIEQIATLEAERAALLSTEQPLHEQFMASPPGSDEEREIGWALDRLCRRIDQIRDAVGSLKHRLYEIDARISRREQIRNAAYRGP